jgi:Kef-type K+ transport system membrane component KefB
MWRYLLFAFAGAMFFVGLFVGGFGAKIDLTDGTEAQAFAVADFALAALLVIAANSFVRRRANYGGCRGISVRR